MVKFMAIVLYGLPHRI